MVINGELVPYDLLPGCKFAIKIDKPTPNGKIKAYVKLFSPADGSLLDDKTLLLEEVCQWLYDRKDW